jgi:hypothetical protein
MLSFSGGLVRATSDHIKVTATRLLRSAGATGEPVDLRVVVSALNLELVERGHEPFACEAALVPMGDTRAIVTRGRGDERRRRFSIAHEIGHFLLHPDRVAPERGGAANAALALQEREADQFAAELLMPADRLRRAAFECGCDVQRLATRFEVSQSAMRIRLERLGLTVGHARRDGR